MAGRVVERDEPFLVQRLKELGDEERIARSLRQHEVREWPGPVAIGVQRVRDELREVRQRQGA